MAKKSAKSATASENQQRAKLDEELLRLVMERAKLVSDSEKGLRLAEIAPAVAKKIAKTGGALDAEQMQAIFNEVAAACRQLATAERVAYLGPEHTFSHAAAIQQFGAANELIPVATIAGVFEEVEAGTAKYGIVPLENSTIGRVTDTLDCFAKSPLQMCGELPLRIHHCLLGSGPRSAIRTVVSKPQALSQCRNWLARHLSGIDLQPIESTALAAQRAAAEPSVAAIAGKHAASEYGLRILAENIEDQSENVTRFAVIGTESAPKSDNDKTALMLELAHEPGALADAMGIFKRNRLNMTWIESFPVAGSRGRYLFFIEFVGHATGLRARRAIASLEKKAERLVVLGSYAHCDPIG